MTQARTQLGDSHNFGRRVSLREGRVVKPRALLWEQLLLSAESPLRRLLDEAAEREGLGREAFGFLPDLQFSFSPDEIGGEVTRIALDPLPAPSPEIRRSLAIITGRSLALWSWLGVTDLHWENLVLGVDARGQVVFTPLDVEMILSDLSMPTETKLLPDADPEYAEVSRHAAGVRRVLPCLGKPIEIANLLAMVGAYRGTLALLDRQSGKIAELLSALPGLGETPIRVLLRGTGEYVHAREQPPWPPLLEAEIAQLARGDIPYFFRLYGKKGIHCYAEPSLQRVETLPTEGDVPQLDPLLQVSRGLRSPTRKKLREDGLFTLLGAFDHPSFTGVHRSDEIEVTFRARTLVVKLPKGEELETKRNLRAFVGSVYLPCRCGEVLGVFVPEVTVCEAGRR